MARRDYFTRLDAYYSDLSSFLQSDQEDVDHQYVPASHTHNLWTGCHLNYQPDKHSVTFQDTQTNSHLKVHQGFLQNSPPEFHPYSHPDVHPDSPPESPPHVQDIYSHPEPYHRSRSGSDVSTDSTHSDGSFSSGLGSSILDSSVSSNGSGLGLSNGLGCNKELELGCNKRLKYNSELECNNGLGCSNGLGFSHGSGFNDGPEFTNRLECNSGFESGNELKARQNQKSSSEKLDSGSYALDKKPSYRLHRNSLCKVSFPSRTWDLIRHSLLISLDSDNVFICDQFLGKSNSMALLQELSYLRNSGMFAENSSKETSSDCSSIYLSEPSPGHRQVDGLIFLVYKLASYYTDEWNKISVELQHYPKGHSSIPFSSRRNSSKNEVLKCFYFPNFECNAKCDGLFTIKSTERIIPIEPKMDRLVVFWGDVYECSFSPCNVERFLVNIEICR